MTWVWISIGTLAVWVVGLTIALCAFIEGHREWVQESSRRILHVKSAFEMHQDDNRKDMRKLRQQQKNTYNGLLTSNVARSEEVLMIRSLINTLEAAVIAAQDANTTPLDPENTEWLYRVNLGMVIGLTCPPSDPDIRTILWENSLDLIEQVGDKDPSLIDSFELLETKPL